MVRFKIVLEQSISPILYVNRPSIKTPVLSTSRTCQMTPLLIINGTILFISKPAIIQDPCQPQMMYKTLGVKMRRVYAELEHPTSCTAENRYIKDHDLSAICKSFSCELSCIG